MLTACMQSFAYKRQIAMHCMRYRTADHNTLQHTATRGLRCSSPLIRDTTHLSMMCLFHVWHASYTQRRGISLWSRNDNAGALHRGRGRAAAQANGRHVWLSLSRGQGYRPLVSLGPTTTAVPTQHPDLSASTDHTLCGGARARIARQPRGIAATYVIVFVCLSQVGAQSYVYARCHVPYGRGGPGAFRQGA